MSVADAVIAATSAALSGAAMPCLDASPSVRAGLRSTVAAAVQELRAHAVQSSASSASAADVVLGISEEYQAWTSASAPSWAARGCDVAASCEAVARLEEAWQRCLVAGTGALAAARGRSSDGVAVSRAVDAACALSDVCQAALDDLWRGGGYSEARMRSLVRAVDQAVALSIDTAAGDPEWLWRSQGGAAVSGALERVGSAAAELARVVRELTGSFWPASGGSGGGSSRAWKGGEEAARACQGLAARAAQVLGLRAAHDDMLELVGRGGAHAAAAALERLCGGVARPLSSTHASSQGWAEAVRGYCESIAPTEDAAVAAIRARIAASSSQQQAGKAAVTAVLSRYAACVSRPRMSLALLAEREAALLQLASAADALEAELEGQATALGTGSLTLAQRVGGVAWAQGIRARLSRSLRSAPALVGTLAGWAAARARLQDAATRAKGMQADLARSWGEEAGRLADSGALSSPEGGALVRFAASGGLEVAFAEAAVAISRQARQLAAMGFAPPPRVTAAAGRAEQLLRFSAALGKVAAFYNSLDAKMLPCVKPLLLEPIDALEAAVATGSASWSDPPACAAYVLQLQGAAASVAGAIDRVRAAHSLLATEVAALASTDALRQQSALRRRVRAVRALVEPVVRGKPLEQAAPWLRHWDRQLYKAVEAAWRMGLESLSESLPAVRCELAVRAGAVEFRPPLEELRAAYYRDLKSFVALPASIRPLLEGGAAEDAGVFRALLERNAGALSAVYRKAEILFARLAKLRDGLAPWASVARLAGGDRAIEALAAALASTPQHWSAALQGLRARRAELERLPDLRSVDCIDVSVGPLKAAVEDSLQQLADALLLSLRRTLVGRLSEVERFVAQGGDRLTRPMTSMGDIAAAQEAFTALQERKPAMAAAVREAEALKRQLVQLAQQAGGAAAAAALAPTVVADQSGEGESAAVPILARVSALPEAWDGFEKALATFHRNVQAERERLRETVASSAAELGKRAASFAARWAGVAPSTDADADWSADGVEAAMRVVAEWVEALGQLEAEAKELAASSTAFGLAQPSWPELPAAAESVRAAEASWGVMREYCAARQALAEQDWLGFRSQAFALQDMAGEWQARCRGEAPRDGVLARIVKECDLVRRAASGFKYARGEPFREEHWSVALMKLGLPRGVKAATLTVGHLLQERVLEALYEHSSFLKDLNSRAQGEVTIREALQELRAWAETCEFERMQHTSLATGRNTPLIREWTEVFTQIGDNQSLLQSLKESSYFKPFADQAAPLEARLGELDQCCQDLNNVQRRWVYLEPIFGRGALPSEQPRFRRVDEEFRAIAARVDSDPRVFNLTDASIYPGLRDSLRSMVVALERCQKALSDFLEAKRAAFPRFYFLGDDDLLEILGQSKDPKIVQTHLPKLFQGISRVQFDGDEQGSNAIAGMFSSAGELVPLTTASGVAQSVKTADTEVEAWLNELVGAMRCSLARSVQACASERGASDLARFPAQALCLASEIAFAARVEAALSTGSASSSSSSEGSSTATAALADLKKEVAATLAELTALAASSGSGSKALSPLLRRKVKSLVLDTIHRVDVLDQLAKDKADAVDSWAWQRQLRFYLPSVAEAARLRDVDRRVQAAASSRAGGGSTGTTSTSHHGAAAGHAADPFHPDWAADSRGSSTSLLLAEARMVSARIPYSYEYQGNHSKLVHTPLTDKCYLALTQGISMGYGGNPYGPAGTGKTESVKALGAALGRQVLVFNCDEGIDFRSMGRIFTGLVRCGSWGCFDEFNRLKPDQLSAVSQQIQVIQAAIKSNLPFLELLGREIAVDSNAGIFVTMNPAGKGYGGRSKLPDNLKQLFRPIAMSKPDNELIAEVLLFAEGFRGARALGRKIASLFGLSSQLLTRAQHYDWGLRAMKTCLNTSGVLLAKRRAGAGAAGVSDSDEASCLIQAIRVNTLSKLTSQDAKRFAALMNDVFPGQAMEDVRLERLEAAIHWVMTGDATALAPGAENDASAGAGASARSGATGGAAATTTAPSMAALLNEGGVALGKLRFDKGQVAKMLQLKESLDQRMGCVIVGPSGCGKTALWRVLRAALQQTGQVVKVHVMNPKAMPRARFLGDMDPDTREWTDGVLTAAARQVVREPEGVRSWIVCDGDVDPEWIESLNSVLDDNHLLTLPNGERIRFGDNVNFLFETHDLRHASPATVSRMGMIFLSDDDVDPSRIIDAWFDEQGGKAVDASALRTWLDTIFLPALRWTRERLSPADLATDTTLVAAVRSGLSQVQGAASAAAFAVGTVRGLGSNIVEDRRPAFAAEVFRSAGETALPTGAASWLDVAADDSGSLVALSAVALSEAGGRAMDDDATAGSSSSGAAVVTTASLLRNSATLATWFERMDPLVLVGPPGCGKSLLVERAVRSRRGTALTVLHCSAQTSAANVVQKLRQGCALFSSTAGRVFRPKEGDRLVLFLRGLDLPKPDKWGTCPLVAFLQQLLAFGGFYDDTLEFIRIERVHIVASMSPKNALGRHALSPRFTAAVRTAYIADPSTEELQAITAATLSKTLAASPSLEDPRFRAPAGSVSAAPSADLERLAVTMVSVWAAVRTRFSQNEQKHYIFTPRDLIEWASGLACYSLAGVSVLDVAAYEGARLLRDKLASEDARRAFDSILAQELRKQWSHSVPPRLVFTAAAPAVMGSSLAAKAAPSAGGDGAAWGPGSRMWPLLEQVKAEDHAAAVQRGMVLFQREERPLSFALFPQAMRQLAVVDRCLSRPGGHLLLIGRPGVGRRSALTLTAHMLGMRAFEPAVGREFGLKQFSAELRIAMTAAALEDGGANCVFVVTESAMEGDAKVLEAVNSLVASGEVPGLFGQDEADTITAPLREAIADAPADSPEAACGSAWELFVLRVRTRLHVAVALDPLSPAFARRCEANPALLTACTVAWFGGWDKETMESLPGMLLGGLVTDKDGEPGFALADAAAKPEAAGDDGELSEDDAGAAGDAARLGTAMADMHGWCDGESHGMSASGDRGGGGGGGGGGVGLPRSPRDFVALVRGFRTVLLSERARVQGDARRLERGLGKLHEAESTVGALQTEAGAQREQLKEKQVAADRAMHDITEALGGASDRRREVEVLSKQAVEAREATAARKASVEAELGGITPVLQAARDAVGGIDQRKLSFISSLKAPPKAVEHVLSGVLRMLGNEDTSWTSMRVFLRSSGVKDAVINLDPRSISPVTRAAVSNVIKRNADSFQDVTIRRASEDAAPLAAWVKACLKFSVVLETIKPLEEELARATAQLERVQRELATNQAELSVIDARVAELKAEFQKRTAEAETLRMHLAKTEDTLARAEALLAKLVGEKSRWEDTVSGARRRLDLLPAKALLAAGFVAYLPGSPEDQRAAATAAWTGLAASLLPAGADAGSPAPVHRMLASESEALEWRSLGLPDDTLSTENAAVILHSEATSGRSPFIVDPAGAATVWLIKQLQGAGAKHGAAPKASAVEVIAESSPRFQTTVELAVRFGKTLVVTEASGVSPMLHALLARDLRVQGARFGVLVGDKPVDYSDSFRAFVCTRDPSTRPQPSARALVTVVNFTVTRSGLEGQLLGATLREVMPSLESEKSRLLREEETLKVQLADLENGLIRELAASEGDLLENKALVESLTQTKAKSADIAKALQGSAETAEEIDRQRDAFRPLAKAGSQLFFLLDALVVQNHMYQFSLSDFLSVFVGTVRHGLGDAIAAAAAGTGASADLAGRAVRLVPELQRRVLLFVGRSLLKEDRLMFGLHLVHGCRPELFGAGEWDIFTGQAASAVAGAGSAGGTASATAGGGGKASLPAWAPPDRAPAFAALQAALPQQTRRAGLASVPLPGDWDAWGRDAEAAIDGMPGEAMGALTAWQRVLVVRTLRPDRLLSALQTFVCGTLGIDSVAPPALDLTKLAREASPRKPLLMISMPGADPTRDLAELAEAAVAAGSLGAEPEPDAFAASAAAGSGSAAEDSGAAETPAPSSYEELAMGGGQQEEALALVRAAAVSGGWVCLKNLHLVSAWLPRLQAELSALEEPHPGFRLWLTTECQDDFPSLLLQESLKVTFEAPPGLRRNLERSVASWPEEYVATGPAVRRHLLGLLAWFHGVVQERRTYVPQGWTKAYEFSAADLRAGASVIDDLVARAAASGGGTGRDGLDLVPWRTLHGILEGAVYGGRVDDPADARVLKAFVRICFHRDLVPRSAEEPARAVTPGVRLPFNPDKAALARFSALLPPTDSPKLFRLPANAERSLQRATSDRVVTALVSLSAASASGSDFDAEAWRASLGPALDGWQAIYAALPAEPKRVLPSGAAAEDPVAQFVYLEAAHGHAMMRLVEADMQALRGAVFGSDLLSASVQELGRSLLASMVPQRWIKEWEGPLEPRSWMRQAAARVTAIESWRSRCDAGRLLSSPVRLNELFRPETLLNAVRQRAARATRVAIDELHLESTFSGARTLEAIGASPELIVQVDGLLLQGTALHGSPPAMAETAPDAPDLSAAPTCSMAWLSAAQRVTADGARISVPLYDTPSREKIIADVSLPVGAARGGAARWIMAGVGVFASGSG